MSFYSGIAASATNVLKQYGQTVVRRDISSGSYDPSTGSSTQSAKISNRIGVELPLGYAQTTIAGTLIQTGSLQLYLDADDEVKTSDRYTFGGKDYTVKSFETIKPAGTPVLNILHLVTA